MLIDRPQEPLPINRWPYSAAEIIRQVLPDARVLNARITISDETLTGHPVLSVHQLFEFMALPRGIEPLFQP
jgi:hypothetical protein